MSKYLIHKGQKYVRVDEDRNFYYEKSIKILREAESLKDRLYNDYKKNVAKKVDEMNKKIYDLSDNETKNKAILKELENSLSTLKKIRIG